MRTTSNDHCAMEVKIKDSLGIYIYIHKSHSGLQIPSFGIGNGNSITMGYKTSQVFDA